MTSTHCPEPDLEAFIDELRALCDRYADTLCGHCMLQVLVEAAAAIIAMNFVEDRGAGMKIARGCASDLRRATTDFMNEIGGRPN